MSIELHKSSVRKALKPSPEPHWGPPIAQGQYVGLRVIAGRAPSWIARYAYKNDRGQWRQKYRALGQASDEFDFDRAKADAQAWFAKDPANVGTRDVQTVSDACRVYVSEREKSKSAGNAHDAKMRFERTIYTAHLGRTRLDKLVAKNLRAWRDALDLSPGASNRTLTAVKAALNLAVREKDAPASLAIELRNVKPLPGGNGRRTLYLDRAQRKKLLAAATGAARDLILAATLTGARATELIEATVAQFDPRTRSMTFVTEKGNDGPRSRTVPIRADAQRLFKRLAKGKASGDRLFTRDDGTPWAHSSWDEPVREAAKAAGLPSEPHTGVCITTLRHSFITTALTSGVPTLDVARLVGTSITMIERNYGHLVAHAARARLAKVGLL